MKMNDKQPINNQTYCFTFLLGTIPVSFYDELATALFTTSLN